MAVNEGIAATTSSGTFDVSVADGASIKLWTYPNLTRGEELQVFQTNGAFLETELILDKKAVCVTHDNNAVKLNGPAIYRIKKPATTETTTVLYDT